MVALANIQGGVCRRQHTQSTLQASNRTACWHSDGRGLAWPSPQSKKCISEQ